MISVVDRDVQRRVLRKDRRGKQCNEKRGVGGARSEPIHIVRRSPLFQRCAAQQKKLRNFGRCALCGQGTAATAEVVNRNIVRGVQPAGQIWVIRDLRAAVKTDGSIRVDGRGLLLGGGNNIGTNGGASVFATLICEAVAPFTERSTTTLSGVPLEPDGDFRIDDVLSSVPTECARPVLLIRNADPTTTRGWFAAGIPKQ